MKSVVHSGRIEQLDAVQGISILGILLLNIYGFGLPQIAYMNPAYTLSVSTSDIVVWSILNIVAQGKFLAIFSLLFGATLTLLVRKGQEWNYRRLIILMLIGLLHGIGLWEGDILLPYAITGMLAITLIYRYSSEKLIKIAISIYLIGLLVLLFIGYHIDAEGYWVLTESQIIDEITLKTAGGMTGIAYRYHEVSNMIVSLFIQYGWQLLALMLGGAILINNGWLLGAYSEGHYQFISKVFILPAILVQIICLYWQQQAQWSYFSTSIVGYIVNEIVIPFQSIGYIALVYGYWEQIKATLFSRWIINIGRMALSNYLLQTLICTTIFYQLDYFGDFNRLELLIFIIPIWLTNIAFSSLWLSYFSQGPIEWMWRKLTLKL